MCVYVYVCVCLCVFVHGLFVVMCVCVMVRKGGVMGVVYMSCGLVKIWVCMHASVLHSVCLGMSLIVQYDPHKLNKVWKKKVFNFNIKALK